MWMLMYGYLVPGIHCEDPAATNSVWGMPWCVEVVNVWPTARVVSMQNKSSIIAPCQATLDANRLCSFGDQDSVKYKSPAIALGLNMIVPLYSKNINCIPK